MKPHISYKFISNQNLTLYYDVDNTSWGTQTLEKQPNKYVSPAM